MDFFTKRYHPPGTPPGTLSESKEKVSTPLSIRLFDFTESEFVEKEIEAADECQPYLARPTITWIHVQGNIEPTTLKQLGNIFGLHPLALEDVLNTGQRPKVEMYDQQLFVVMSLPVVMDGHTGVEQISLFLGENFLISFHNGNTDLFEPIRRRLRNHIGRSRFQKTDYLLYALLDVIIDQGFPILETYGEKVEDLEDEVLENPTNATIGRIHEIKRDLLLLRRMLWPQREVINLLMREDFILISSPTKVYLRDCYDHTVHIMDLLETYREMTASMLDVYLSSVSYRLNDIMRVLTLIATIFMPLTFIVGVYGMNFGNNMKSPWAMPELHMYYGYPLIWLVMIAVVIGMIFYFKHKKWI